MWSKEVSDSTCKNIGAKYARSSMHGAVKINRRAPVCCPVQEDSSMFTSRKIALILQTVFGGQFIHQTLPAKLSFRKVFQKPLSSQMKI